MAHPLDGAERVSEAVVRALICSLKGNSTVGGSSGGGGGGGSSGGGDGGGGGSGGGQHNPPTTAGAIANDVDPTGTSAASAAVGSAPATPQWLNPGEFALDRTQNLELLRMALSLHGVGGGSGGAIAAGGRGEHSSDAMLWNAVVRGVTSPAAVEAIRASLLAQLS
jgi:hypothetical protein